MLIVDGPVAVGKSKLAKALADDLGMQYFPEANQDMWTTNAYGYNYKELNDQLPSISKFVDIKDFLLNPKSENSARFQFDQLMVKCVRKKKYTVIKNAALLYFCVGSPSTSMLWPICSTRVKVWCWIAVVFPISFSWKPCTGRSSCLKAVSDYYQNPNGAGIILF